MNTEVERLNDAIHLRRIGYDDCKWTALFQVAKKSSGGGKGTGKKGARKKKSASRTASRLGNGGRFASTAVSASTACRTGGRRRRISKDQRH